MTLRFVCTHFTNMVRHHLYVLSESGRLRQARALAHVLPADGPLVVPPASFDDRRATFGPMRLDHILLRLPDGWHARVRRAESRYGSDHYPLVAVIDAR